MTNVPYDKNHEPLAVGNVVNVIIGNQEPSCEIMEINSEAETVLAYPRCIDQISGLPCYPYPPIEIGFEHLGNSSYIIV